jgi:Restriction endonuclease/NACHT domain
MSGSIRIGDVSGKAFEVRVADAYRSLGYQVTHNVQLPGKQTDIIAQTRVQGGPLLTLAIECKDEARAVTNTVVLAFVHRVSAHANAGEITSGVMVSSNGFTPDARAAASVDPRVQLLSWEELESDVLDVRHGLGQLVEHYEKSAIYQDYLSLRIESLSWSTLDSSLKSSPDLDEVLARFVGAVGSQAKPNILFVLADFGAGKTTLMRHVQYERAKSYLAGTDERVPLFVPLRNFRQTQDLTMLLRASFRDSFFVDPPADLLWRRIKQGKFYLLLDAFDEMVERSDSDRRLDLFHQMLTVMRSSSPTMLSSRPSYFVERGELDELLAALHEHEAQISGALPHAGGASAIADRLRRKLVAANRESQPGLGAGEMIGTQVKVIRLLPLEPEDIERYIEGKRSQLAKVNVTPLRVMAFIEDTYDLTDLASRPLLLKLIVESVLDQSIDLDETGTQLGPSGLYETYTRAKLDLDQDKHDLPRGALSLDARRTLAERAALAMYAKDSLEVDFEQVLADTASNGGPVGTELTSSQFSGAEMATDFATCSFVTLEQDGSCRFIHKSFRGFFVARVLKEEMDKPGKLLHQELEREVLYFLGGFAPTQPSVGNALWTAFKHSDTSKKALRRNMLVSYLYTSPRHRQHVVQDGEITNADFNRLAFEKTEMKRTLWSRVTVKQLELRNVRWRDVTFDDCHVVALKADGGSAELELKEAAIETVDSDKAILKLKAARSSINKVHARGGMLRVSCTDGEIEDLRLSYCDVKIAAGNMSLGRVEAEECQLAFGSTAPKSGLKATRSFISYSGDQTEIAEWEFDDCVVVLTAMLRSSGRSWRVPLAARNDQGAIDTIMVAPRGVEAYPLEALPAGVFGKLGSSSGSIIEGTPRGWGLLNAEQAFGDRGIVVPSSGYRVGDLILVGEKRYEELVGTQGKLSAMARLNYLADVSLLGEGTGPRWFDEIVQVRTEVIAQHRALLNEPWVTFQP